jgi:hypothetical protein
VTFLVHRSSFITFAPFPEAKNPLYCIDMRRALSVAVIGSLLLTGCLKKQASPETIQTSNATNALSMTVNIASFVEPFLRPSANLGLFTALYVSQSGFFPVIAALKGIAAEMQMHTSKDLGSDSETYALLQEFGGILRTDVPDLLNRSSDRPRTLNEYLAGLENITTRSQRKLDELTASITELTDDQKAKKARVSEIQSTIQKALRDKDYAGAAAEQQGLGEAQSALSQADSKLSVTKNVAKTYKDLLLISDRRKKAIEANREVIIAGLTVVQLPGIEDLDILEKGNSSFGGGNGGSTGFFQF